MRRDSSLTEQQRATVVALFEEGYGRGAVATQLRLSGHAIKALFDRWRLHGRDAIVTRSTKRTFAFEVKREIVQRHLAGETKLALAREFDLSSPNLITAWARIVRDEGEDGLRPKPKGRRRPAPDAPVPARSELDRLRDENERLRAENAYLGKLTALMAHERR